MLGDLEDQMVTIPWQVPQQMLDVTHATIYITVEDRHTHICKRTVGLFLFGVKLTAYKNKCD